MKKLTNFFLVLFSFALVVTTAIIGGQQIKISEQQLNLTPSKYPDLQFTWFGYGGEPFQVHKEHVIGEPNWDNSELQLCVFNLGHIPAKLSIGKTSMNNELDIDFIPDRVIVPLYGFECVNVSINGKIPETPFKTQINAFVYCASCVDEVDKKIYTSALINIS